MRGLDTKYILDSTAFYSGLYNVNAYTTPLIIDEVKHIKGYYGIIDTLIASNMLKVIEPSKDSIDDAIGLAERSGDIDKLSEADISLIALALEVKDAIVVTDDYAIINVLRLADVKVKSMIKDVRKVGRWIKYCKVCKVRYGSKDKVCKVCGNKLSKRLVT